ncbi:30S ribosome-binding factor RbfA [bacterium]|jgi:ribosome-binding factor A|nr:30S ribosome-binding factor RbfA [bacterium]
MSLRNERVRKELMRDISEIIHREIRGLEGVVSIVDVEVSHDNSFAKVIYSVLGSPDQIEKDKEVIEKNTGRIRYEVGKRIRLRVTPELKFVFSDGLEQGSRVLDLIEKISKGEIK